MGKEKHAKKLTLTLTLLPEIKNVVFNPIYY